MRKLIRKAGEEEKENLQSLPTEQVIKYVARDYLMPGIFSQDSTMELLEV